MFVDSKTVLDRLRHSVIAVPPLARDASLALVGAENRRLVADLAAGGVTTLLYGGNANLYHLGLDEYPALLDLLAATADGDTWMIPSIGPDYGRMIAQARVLAERDFPTAMVLPQSFPATQAGIETGIRHAQATFGRPLIAYVKSDGYLSPAALARLVDEGAVFAVKYAVVRDTPEEDVYLTALIDALGAERVISGIGERPVIAHWQTFGVRAFTSGGVCVAPTLSNRIRQALQQGDIEKAQILREHFLALEDQRDAISPIRVMHDAVTLSGAADMGPMLPLLSGLDEHETRRVGPAVRTLREAELAARRERRASG
ncbi:dihydrodipicolinate synthase family protein [Salinicola halophilus]|uniref:dihydrodipicolinate synthase family protein n=1 Tax=Salinicola halophilus TaxID=184065 RepID=UPI000DA1310A|nr:dihydrodipicolinate synthase family protein [Salinicola halophilus]